MTARRLLHFSVFLIWVGALVTLHQQVSSRAFLDEGARISVADGSMVLCEDNLVLYLAGQPSGMSNFLLERKQNPANPQQPQQGALHYSSILSMRFAALGVQLGTRISSDGYVNEDLTLRSVNAEFSAAGAGNKIEAVRQGNEIIVKTGSEGYVHEKRIPVEGPVYPPDVMHLVAARQGLNQGAVYQLQGFEPMTAAVGTFEVKILGPRTIQSVKGPIRGIVIETEFQRVTSTMVLNPQDSSVYLMEADLGGMPFQAIREQESEQGLLPAPKMPEGNTADFLAQSLMLSNVLIERPQDVKRMVVTMQPMEPRDLVLDGYTQRALETDTQNVSMRVEIISPHFTTGTPRGGGAIANSNPAGKEFLSEEQWIQVNHPMILTKAKQVTHGASGTWDAATKIADFLYTRIDKSIRPTVPSAIEVLKTMSGDCNEHSTLFCAMARAVGIPTKIIAGLVYIDGKWGYHAWNEVMVGNRWYPIDSTLNRIQMDAAHIKLAEGGLDKQVAIAHLVGKLKVHIENYEYK